MDADTIKVHLFYLDNYIYAFTATKEIAKKFMAQRCMKKLKHRVEKMDRTQWSLFSKKHNSLMLIENPFDTKTGCMNLVTTYGEDEQVSAFIAKLEGARDECLSSLIERIGFKRRIESILRNGLEMMYVTDLQGGICYNLSALEIMIYLFEPTFTGYGEVKTQRIVDFDLN